MPVNTDSILFTPAFAQSHVLLCVHTRYNLRRTYPLQTWNHVHFSCGTQGKLSWYLGHMKSVLCSHAYCRSTVCTIDASLCCDSFCNTRLCTLPANNLHMNFAQRLQHSRRCRCRATQVKRTWPICPLERQQLREMNDEQALCEYDW